MCKGTKTILACGHQLINYTFKCPPTEGAACADVNLKAYYYNRCCSKCDPAAQRKMLQTASDQHRSWAAAQYGEAAEAGDKQSMQQLEWENILYVGKLKTENYRSEHQNSAVDD